MTGEKITSRWLEHRHANCFQLIAAHRSIFIKWITVRLLIYSQEAADQFHRERGGRRADAGWRAKNPKVTRKLSVYTIQCLFLPHCAEVRILQTDPKATDLGLR